MTRRLPRYMAIAVFSALAACSGSPTGNDYGQSSNPNPNPNPAPVSSNNIAVRNNVFSPASKTVAVNSTVTWDWDSCSGGDGYGNGETCVEHNIVFDDGITSGAQSTGSFSHSFTAAGSYPYHCAIHGSSMSGTIVVQ